MSENDPINPDHYRAHPSGVQCIEVTRFMNFNKGNAVKYIWRSEEKGQELQDLKKAIWYLEDEVRLLEAGFKTARGGPTNGKKKKDAQKGFDLQPGAVNLVDKDGNLLETSQALKVLREVSGQ